MIGRLKSHEYVKQGIEELKQIAIKYKKDGAAPYISKYLANIQQARTQQNDHESAKTADIAIKEIGDAK
jgi:aminopeptidase N